MISQLKFFVICLSIFPIACRQQLKTYTTPQAVDTHTREVRLLPDTIFTTPSGVVAKADFPGARLASFRESSLPDSFGRSLYIGEIPPENSPINSSPWYAFKLESSELRAITVRLVFPPNVGNRYLPKSAPQLSGPYSYISSNNFDTSFNQIDIRLDVGPQGIFLSGQEIINVDSTRRYISKFIRGKSIEWDTIGESVLGRPIWKLDSKLTKKDTRPTVLLFTRQHPPEVTGFQAFQSFLERIFTEDELGKSFRKKYRIIVFPTVNPDGVDEGHWRHNAGGVDLNRDWGEYRQPEVLQIVTWLQNNTLPNQVVWGMDFHSTQYDVLYTHDPLQVKFRGADTLNRWTTTLEEAISKIYAAPYKPNRTKQEYYYPVLGQDTLRIEAEAIGRPTSASWVALHYGSIGVTYEVADEQDRDFIRHKAKLAAELWMENLLR